MSLLNYNEGDAGLVVGLKFDTGLAYGSELVLQNLTRERNL
jgi:hypothetical protein